MGLLGRQEWSRDLFKALVGRGKTGSNVWGSL